MRKLLPILILVMLLLSAVSALAEDEVIYPQPVQITVAETGDYRISFEGDLGMNEVWAWFVCSDEDSAEDLLDVMRGALADETPVRGLQFDYMFSIYPVHGAASIPVAKVPAGSKYVFYGKSYRGEHTFDGKDELYMISLGGTNLSKIRPGEVGGNDLTDGRNTPPATGDVRNPVLWSAAAAFSLAGILMLSIRRKKDSAK